MFVLNARFRFIMEKLSKKQTYNGHPSNTSFGLLIYPLECVPTTDNVNENVFNIRNAS